MTAAFCFVTVQNSHTWRTDTLQKKASGLKPVLSLRDSPLCLPKTLDVSRAIKWTRPSPSVFAYCKQSKTGWWEGLGMRLRTYQLQFTPLFIPLPPHPKQYYSTYHPSNRDTCHAVAHSLWVCSCCPSTCNK